MTDTAPDTVPKAEHDLIVARGSLALIQTQMQMIEAQRQLLQYQHRDALATVQELTPSPEQPENDAS